GYLTQINTQTGKISRDQHNPGNSSSLSSGIYHVMAEDGSGQFWVGGNQGLMKLDRESREVTHYIHEPRNENWARNYITALLPIAETKDQLWVGSGKGL